MKPLFEIFDAENEKLLASQEIKKNLHKIDAEGASVVVQLSSGDVKGNNFRALRPGDTELVVGVYSVNEKGNLAVLTGLGKEPVAVISTIFDIVKACVTKNKTIETIVFRLNKRALKGKEKLLQRIIQKLVKARFGSRFEIKDEFIDVSPAMSFIVAQKRNAEELGDEFIEKQEKVKDQMVVKQLSLDFDKPEGDAVESELTSYKGATISYGENYTVINFNKNYGPAIFQNAIDKLKLENPGLSFRHDQNSLTIDARLDRGQTIEVCETVFETDKEYFNQLLNASKFDTNIELLKKYGTPVEVIKNVYNLKVPGLDTNVEVLVDLNLDSKTKIIARNIDEKQAKQIYNAGLAQYVSLKTPKKGLNDVYSTKFDEYTLETIIHYAKGGKTITVVSDTDDYNHNPRDTKPNHDYTSKQGAYDATIKAKSFLDQLKSIVQVNRSKQLADGTTVHYGKTNRGLDVSIKKNGENAQITWPELFYYNAHDVIDSIPNAKAFKLSAVMKDALKANVTVDKVKAVVDAVDKVAYIHASNMVDNNLYGDFAKEDIELLKRYGKFRLFKGKKNAGKFIIDNDDHDITVEFVKDIGGIALIVDEVSKETIKQLKSKGLDINYSQLHSGNYKLFIEDFSEKDIEILVNSLKGPSGLTESSQKAKSLFDIAKTILEQNMHEDAEFLKKTYQ